MNVKKVMLKGLVVASSVLGVASAFAQEETGSGLLPSEVTSSISAVGADITTVGVAIIGLAVIALGIRWIKATFF